MSQQTTHINWANIRERIGEGENAMKRAESIVSSRMEDIFHQRAIQLARTFADGAKVEGDPVLNFSLGGQRYAVELKYVGEVMRLPNYTPVPGGPPTLLGVIHHRGEVRSVMDLCMILNGSPSPSTEGFFLLLHDGGRQLRVRVDSADEVQRMELDKLASAAASGTDTATRFIKGIDSNGTVVLNVEAILTKSASKDA